VKVASTKFTSLTFHIFKLPPVYYKPNNYKKATYWWTTKGTFRVQDKLKYTSIHTTVHASYKYNIAYSDKT